METALFFVFASVAVAASLLLVLFRNPVYSALALVTTFFSLAGLFVLLDAHFLAAVQVIVYAGAIMVLFLFVIMLLNLGHAGALEVVTGRYRRVSVVFLLAILVSEVGLLAGRQIRGPSVDNAELVTHNIPAIGRLLYTDFLFPFEVASMVLLVALVGVVVLVKREAPSPQAAAAGEPGSKGAGAHEVVSADDRRD